MVCGNLAKTIFNLKIMYFVTLLVMGFALVAMSDKVNASSYVSGGVESQLNCSANDNSQRYECTFRLDMMTSPTSVGNYNTGWSDFLCAKFGYMYGSGASSTKSIYLLSGDTNATFGNCGDGWYQMGTYNGGDSYFGNRKYFSGSFNVGYSDFKKKSEKTSYSGYDIYSGSICLRYPQYWYNAYNGINQPQIGTAYTSSYRCSEWNMRENKRASLTAKSISVSGVSLSNISGLGDKKSSAEYGGSASVRHGDNSGYTFKGWTKNSNGSGYANAGNVQYSEVLYGSDVTVYAVYEKKQEQRVLTVQNKNIYDDSNIGGSYEADSGYNQWKVVSQNNAGGNTDKYKFIGWKTSNSVGTSGIIERTSSNNDTYKTYLDSTSRSGSAVYYKKDDTTAKYIYTRIYNYFNTDRTLYAYYAPKYELSIDVDDGVMLTVNRKFSYYGSRGVINENNAIFKDDRLKICLTVRNGYTLSKFTIKSGSGSAVSISPSSKYCTDVIADEYNVTNDTTIVAKTAKNEFEGMVRVSEAADAWSSVPDSKKASTGWTNVNGTKIIYNIQDCDPVNGCTVRFYHWLRRKSGDGGTIYGVSRTSNYGTISSDRSVLSGREEFSDIASSMVRTEIFRNKLFPGQVVCEKLAFAANAEVGNVSITACASALGKASTDLDLKVKNNDVSKYNNPSGEVWAKPGDKITFLSTYDPVLQYAYNLVPEKIQINGGRYIYPADGKNAEKNMKDMFDSNKPSNMLGWNNSYYVYSSNFTGTQFSGTYRFDGGDTKKHENSNEHTVSESEVGLELIERAEINYERSGENCNNSASCTTPSQIEFTDVNGYNKANVITENIERRATAYVPYNFNTGAEVITNDKTFFAGEEATVKFGVSVLKRINNLTTDGTEEQAYATRMHNAKVRMVFYYANDVASGSESWGTNATDLCSYFGLTNDGQNCGYAGELDGLTLSPKANGGANEYTAKVNVKDVPAGSKICAAVAVYPSNSGYDRQLSAFGSGKWRISDSKCFSIAKRPSFQVWGGSVYSAGNISVKPSAKNNLAAYSHRYPYSMTNNNDHRVFGSWVELGLVANGAVTGLASGAGTGYGIEGINEQGIPAAARDADLGGSAEGQSLDYCVRSTLSFANVNCKASSGAVGGLGGMLQNNVSSNKRALISEFTDEEDTSYTIETAKEVGEISNFRGTEVDGMVKTTRVIASTGSIKINGNIEYANDGYTGLGEVPKIIIYSGKNILISCDVTRIDAVLIAEGAVNTCVDPDDASRTVDVDEEMRSSQLRINGSIISNTLTLGRTYGAATGVYSIVPAEIINYDTSLYLWSKKQNVATGTDKLVEAYTSELAPRY